MHPFNAALNLLSDITPKTQGIVPDAGEKASLLAEAVEVGENIPVYTELWTIQTSRFIANHLKIFGGRIDHSLALGAVVEGLKWTSP